MTLAAPGILATVRRLADDMLFPDAMRVDGLDVLPGAHLSALAVTDGSNSITTGQHPQRLAREARFLLVFGSRPAIKSALLRHLGATAG
jgi:hypothetical protein